MTRFFNYLTGFLWLFALLLWTRLRKKSPSPQWPKQPWILGHRGARALAPENTLSSFRLAMEHGADGVEFDVILSKDCVPMVIHDDTLERTTNGHGLVTDLSAQELKNLDATKIMPQFTKEGVPSLAETLSALPGGTITNIELKSPGRFAKAALVEKVLSVARLHQDRLIIIFSSFDGEILSLLRAQKPNYLISLLLCNRDHHWPWALKYWHHIQPDALHLPPSLATNTILSLAKKAQLPVAIWTINDPMVAHNYFAHGVSGIFTDRVPEVVSLKVSIPQHG